jgi:hypothetical protein
MDRNLGATSASPGDVGALGLLYQWGRKDPFVGSSSIYSDIFAETSINLPKPVVSKAKTGTIAYATSHPTTLIIHNDDNSDWYYTGTSSKDETRWQSEKTVYDPCPQGYRVPPAGYLHYIGTVSGNATGTSVNTNFGIYLKTGSGDNKTFIPQCGVLRSRGFVGTGSESEYSLSYPKHRGYVWSSIPRNTDQGCYLFWFNSSAINKATTEYLNGFCETTAQAIPVRCIKE